MFIAQLIALLIQFGILLTENDWNTLSTAEQEQYKTEYRSIITDDAVPH